MEQVFVATSTLGLSEKMAHRLLTRSPLGLLVRWVARMQAPVHAKLLGAFLLVTLLFIAMGELSLQTIARMSRQSRLLHQAHERVDASHQIEHALAMQMNFIAMALLLGFVISWAFILPVQEAQGFLGQVAQGDFSTTIEVPNRDEFGTLADCGLVRRVDVSTDGGKTWRDARLQEPVLPRAHTRFRLEWRWDGREAVLQSQCTDETGYVQPTLAELVRVRVLNSIYFNNAIQNWKVAADGSVHNIHA